MAEGESKRKRIKEMSERSKNWDAEYFLKNFQEEMDRLERGMSHMVWDADDRRITACVRPLPITPKFEISETDEAFNVKVTLPGISKEDIKLNVDRDKIEIFACPDETTCKPFYVSFDPHAPLDPDSVEAKLEGGVLEVNAAKKKKTRLRVR